MAADDKLTLKAEPSLVASGGKIVLTATLTDAAGAARPGVEVTFTAIDPAGVEAEIDSPKTGTDGSAKTDFAAPASSDAKTVIKVKASTQDVTSHPPELEIAVFATTLDLKLADLSQKTAEQQQRLRDAAQAEKAVQALQQDIDALKKAVTPPDAIRNAIADYRAVVNDFNARLANAESEIKQVDESVVAQTDKTLRDEIAGKHARITQERKELVSRREQLKKEIKDLDNRMQAAGTLLDEKEDALTKLKETKTEVESEVSDLTREVRKVKTEVNNGIQAKDKLLVACASAELLVVKDSMAEVKGKVIDPAALDKKLTETWQQINAQKQANAALEDQKTAKAAELQSVLDRLDELTRTRREITDQFVNDLLTKPA